MSGLLADGICATYHESVGKSRHEQQIFTSLKKCMQKRLSSTILEEINIRIPELFKDKEYHANDIEESLIKMCTEILSDVGSGNIIQNVIYCIPDEVMAILNNLDSEEYISCLKFIDDVQNSFESNRKKLLISQIMDSIVHRLIVLYQEVFSDLAAVILLGCSFDDYKESFAVSEGIKVYDTRQTDEQRLRERLVEYAKSCYNEISRARDWYKKEVDAVRKQYCLFTSEKCTMGQIYQEMQNCIQEYKCENLYCRRKDIDIE